MCENFGNSGGEGGGYIWGSFLENPDGRGGVIQQIPSVGVVWICSGTTQLLELHDHHSDFVTSASCIPDT